MRQEILDLNRGIGGVGSVTINRKFIRAFGLDAAFVLSDLIRAHLWCDKNNTLEGEWFYWNAYNLEENLLFPSDRIEAAAKFIQHNSLIRAKKNEEGELMVALNLELLKEYGGMKAYL